MIAGWTVCWAAAAGTYAFGTPGLNACASGYSLIVSASDCQLAAEALTTGFAWGPGDWSTKPRGCFFDGSRCSPFGAAPGECSLENVYFNTHGTGGVDHSNDTTLCRLGNPPTPRRIRCRYIYNLPTSRTHTPLNQGSGK